jgi:phosphoserine phosphatase
MKRFIAYTLILLLVSCNNKPNNKNTFIFDFDDTTIRDAILLKVISVSAKNDSIKIAKIKELIKQKKKNGQPVIHLILGEIEKIVGRKITLKDFNIASKLLQKDITLGLVEVIKNINARGHDVMIIGGAYSTCSSIKKILIESGINTKYVISGIDSFDKDGNLLLDKNNIGFFDCNNGTKIVGNFVKSDVIKYLKQQNMIHGKVIHIGDGENDLEVSKAGEADVFIGFGVNKIVPKVQKEAPIFVNNIEEFKSVIFRYA